MTIRRLLAGLLVIALFGCSDDSEAPPTSDSSADSAVTDTAVGSDSTADSAAADSAAADTAADTAVTPDIATGDGGGTPKILTSSHTGWGKKNCFDTGCHSSPIKGHTATTPPECAKCHGGNGACNPNGSNSNKKNHAKTTCATSNCHGSKHGYSDKADCVSCHFASQGTVDCP